jgi:ribonuclease D
VELAKRHPADIDGLRAIRGIHPSLIKRRGAALLEAIAHGLADPPIPREERHPRPDPGDAPLIALAEALLRSRALETGLAYELIATRSDLERIIGAARRGEPEPDVRTLTGWRRELVGGDIEQLLSGRTAVAVGPGGKLELRSQ